MKTSFYIVGLVSVIFLSGCGGGGEVSDYDKPIPQAIVAQTSKDSDTTLGDLTTNKVVAVVKKGAFEDTQNVEIKTPKNIPEQKDSTILGSPIEVSVEGEESVRFDAPTTITMAFDKSQIPEGADESFLRVGYYDGNKWEYIKPDSVDMEAGTMTFDTYHFSTYSPSISEKQQITQQFIHSQALDNVIRDNVNNESDYVTQQIVAMTLAKMGITDEKTQEKIFEKVASAESYKEIYDLYQKGDTEGAAQKTALLAGSTIANNVPASVFKDALGGVIDAADDVAKVSEAAGYAAEGKYEEAAKIIGEQIADKFLITTAGKIAAEVVDGQINSWKNGEVEAAYEAYTKGADGYFWGYNVDKGDFDSVWDQMRGIRRQLELEAIKKENAIRAEAGMPELSEKEMTMVRTRVKQQYKKQFKQREESETEIKKEEERLKTLFEAFDEKNVFVDGLGPQTLNKKGYTYEQKLEIMNHFSDKIMQDTGRTEVTSGNVGLSDTKISTAQIIIAAKKYFSEPDGKKKYEEYIKEEFGVNKYPSIDELKGAYNGTATITDIEVSDEFRQKVENGEGPEGCDLNMLEEMKDKPNPMPLTINPTSKTGGQITFGDDEDAKPMPFSYYDGKIEVDIIDDEMNGKVWLDAVKNEDGTISMTGNMHVEMEEGGLIMKADMNAKK
jgi:hypothetical protein